MCTYWLTEGFGQRVAPWKTPSCFLSVVRFTVCDIPSPRLCTCTRVSQWKPPQVHFHYGCGTQKQGNSWQPLHSFWFAIFYIFLFFTTKKSWPNITFIWFKQNMIYFILNIFKTIKNIDSIFIKFWSMCFSASKLKNNRAKETNNGRAAPMRLMKVVNQHFT